MIDTPTLLIGLGGAGGKIAFEVWNRLPDAGKEYVGLHIFDTDRNPESGLGKPEFKPLWDNGMITQTSPAMTVGQCYSEHLVSTQVARWFPNSDAVGQKPMTDGAGQVRAVSRLAFLDTLARGDMRKLDAAIEKLLSVRPQRGIGAFRVLIVDTLAGGTGSGIFLQVPMYIRHYLETVRGRTNVVIRNVSVLPGVFINTGGFKGRPQQKQNLLANGYAAIKELDGLIISRNSDMIEAEKRFVFPLEMEYTPGSKNAAPVGTGPSPYETIFLIDHINGNGQSLQVSDHYIDQAIDTIHLQLLSPMEGKINGQADNNIRDIDRTNGRARYASMGSATLRYPYQDILRYLALRWASHGLDEQWLKIDKLYRIEVEEALRKKRRDPSTEVPSLRERYVEILDHLGTGDTADVFFKQAKRSVQIITKDVKGTEQSQEKVSVWLSGVEKSINAAVERVGAVTLGREVDSGALRRATTFVDEVTAGLAEIETLHRKAASVIESTASMVTNEVLWQDADTAPYVLMNNESRLKATNRLNTWMLKPGLNDETVVEGLHPVAVRYFLCRALGEINKRYRATETEAKSLRENLENLRSNYDDPKTPVKESAHDKALAVRSELNWWNKKGKLDEFAIKFERDIKQTGNLIASWASKSIEHEVLRRLKSVIEGMITDWEVFFRDLGTSLRQSLLDEVAREERANESVNPMVLNVLGSADSKRRFWNQVSADFAHDGVSAEVCARMYQAHYLKAVAKRDDPEGLRRAMGEESEVTRRMFEEHVVGWCADQLKGRAELDLDVVSAIRKEWEISSGTGANADEWLRIRIEEVRSIAAPWLPPLGNIDAAHMVFWGISDDVSSKMNGRQFQDMFSMNGDNPVVNSEFSRYEIKRFAAVFAVSIGDIPGFRVGTGQYWKAYENMRSETLSSQGHGLTPHCDKRWDSPACLREMDDIEQDIALSRLQLATLYAVFIKEIDLYPKDGNYRWHYYEGDLPRDLLMFNGEPCAPDVIGLYHGLAANYHLVGALCSLAKESENRARREVSNDFAALPLIKSGHTLLETMLKLASHGGRMDERSQAILKLLVNALSDEILAAALRFHGATNPNTAIKAAENALASIRSQSKVVQSESLSDLEINILSLLENRPRIWKSKLSQMETVRSELGKNAPGAPLVFMG